MSMLSLPDPAIPVTLAPAELAPKPLAATAVDEKPAALVILNNWESNLALIRIWLRVARLAFNHIPNPLRALRALQRLENTRRQYMGDYRLRKVTKAGGRYFFDLNTPGWPSLAFDQYHLAELNRIEPFREKPLFLKVLLLAITKKCALQCAHCFEWDALNGKEKLSVENLKTIIQKFQTNGVAQVQFSGGEPLLRMPAMLEVIGAAAPGTDFWVITSGHRLTPEAAFSLRQAGLTGVTISLDHINPHLHNEFRGFTGAYEWVEQAAANARNVGLLISLSLCATRSFTTEANLMAYTQLAQKLGAAFVQVLEPKAVGHYIGQEVSLTVAQQQLLDQFYIKLNYDPKYHHLPIIVYHEYHRRRAGCTGAADRYVYVDTDGELHACPFCRKTSGSAFGADLNIDLQRLRKAGCPDTLSTCLGACQSE
jgi:MoaA/NifB/PqqE/SkfB family radical SAM enzyme